VLNTTTSVPEVTLNPTLTAEPAQRWHHVCKKLVFFSKVDIVRLTVIWALSNTVLGMRCSHVNPQVAALSADLQRLDIADGVKYPAEVL
jgi:hypothetical protein